jgi:hypothetical protein
LTFSADRAARSQILIGVATQPREGGHLALNCRLRCLPLLQPGYALTELRGGGVSVGRDLVQ